MVARSASNIGCSWWAWPTESGPSPSLGVGCQARRDTALLTNKERFWAMSGVLYPMEQRGFRWSATANSERLSCWSNWRSGASTTCCAKRVLIWCVASDVRSPIGPGGRGGEWGGCLWWEGGGGGL